MVWGRGVFGVRGPLGRGGEVVVWMQWGLSVGSGWNALGSASPVRCVGLAVESNVL